jgi:radical SAM-linked protein
MFERACRRAGVPLSFTGGYSPKPRINFALSLPTGTEALAEWLDLELAEAWPAELIMETLNIHLPSGIRIVDCWKVPVDVPALNSRVRYMNYRARLPEPLEGAADIIQKFMDRPEINIVRMKKGKKRTLDIKKYLVQMDAPDDRTLEFSLALKGEQGSARPQEVLQALMGDDRINLSDVRLTRTGLTLSLEPDKAGSRPGWARIWD